MRTIKFRVWDNDGYMSKPFTLQDLQDKRIQFTPECQVMQFTGLTDKNGKEIYEGDILSCKVYIDGKWQYSKEPVIFVDGCFALDWSFKKDGTYYEILAKEVNDKVILGNIHENPELL